MDKVRDDKLIAILYHERFPVLDTSFEIELRLIFLQLLESAGLNLEPEINWCSTKVLVCRIMPVHQDKIVTEDQVQPRINAISYNAEQREFTIFEQHRKQIKKSLGSLRRLLQN